MTVIYVLGDIDAPDALIRARAAPTEAEEKQSFVMCRSGTTGMSSDAVYRNRSAVDIH